MIQESKLPENWTAVGFSQDLQKGQINIALVEETELVVWRDQNGQAHAWDNRCPHRGTRLSLGFVRENQLACPYHGWQFGRDGQCVYTPSIPDTPPPKSLKAFVHGCMEFFGLIWVAPLDSSLEDFNKLKMDLEESNDFQPIRSIIIERSSKNIIDGIASIPFPPSKRINASLCNDSNTFNLGKTEQEFIWEDGEEQTITSYQMNKLQPGFFQIICKSEGSTDILLFALQKIQSQKTAVHLILVPDNWSTEPISLKLAYTKWSKIFRHQLEEVS